MTSRVRERKGGQAWGGRWGAAGPEHSLPGALQSSLQNAWAPLHPPQLSCLRLLPSPLLSRQVLGGGVPSPDPGQQPGPHMLTQCPLSGLQVPLSPHSSLGNRSFFGSGPVGNRFPPIPGLRYGLWQNSAPGPRPEPAQSRWASMQVNTEVPPTSSCKQPLQASLPLPTNEMLRPTQVLLILFQVTNPSAIPI